MPASSQPQQRRAATAGCGKRVGGALYLHASAVAAAAPAIRRQIGLAAAAVPGRAWNVAKVTGSAVSLLLYEDFGEAAFPALLAAARIGPKGGPATCTDYRNRANPPILHRKETLLPLSDPRRAAYAAVTRTAEDHGLFAEPHRIGTRQAWLARVAAAGLEILGTELVPRRAG
jgi:hypothetical protein